MGLFIDQLLSFTITGGANFAAAFGAFGVFGGGDGGGGGTSIAIGADGGGGGGGGASIAIAGGGGGGGGTCFKFFCAIEAVVIKHTASTSIVFFIMVIF